MLDLADSAYGLLPLTPGAHLCLFAAPSGGPYAHHRSLRSGCERLTGFVSGSTPPWSNQTQNHSCQYLVR